jgi:glutaredoxin
MVRWRIFGRRPSAPVPVVLYTRRDCPLCEEAKRELARARTPLAVREVDVDGDEGLRAAYGERVPVIEIDGRVACEGRVAASEIERALARRAGS